MAIQDVAPARMAAAIQTARNQCGSDASTRGGAATDAARPSVPAAIMPAPDTLVKAPARAIVSRMNRRLSAARSLSAMGIAETWHRAREVTSTLCLQVKSPSNGQAADVACPQYLSNA